MLVLGAIAFSWLLLLVAARLLQLGGRPGGGSTLVVIAVVLTSAIAAAGSRWAGVNSVLATSGGAAAAAAFALLAYGTLPVGESRLLELLDEIPEPSGFKLIGEGTSGSVTCFEECISVGRVYETQLTRDEAHRRMAAALRSAGYSVDPVFQGGGADMVATKGRFTVAVIVPGLEAGRVFVRLKG